MTKRGWNTLGGCLLMVAIILGVTTLAANGIWLVAVVLAFAGAGCFHIAETGS